MERLDRERVSEASGEGAPEGSQETVVVIGAGPAGLGAAYELIKQGKRPIVIEHAHIVGGLARTETYKGYRFDMGGHRFFTKCDAIGQVWRDILGKDLLRRPRLSRIYYRSRFYHYPLKPLNVLGNLGLIEACRIVMSYLRWQCIPHRREQSFEEWVTNRFGRRLFETFFKTYTEKVWGISCTELKAEWAAQRIKDLSLKTALFRMFFTSRQTIRTLIEEFHYPRLGPGMMWNALKEHIESHGGEVRLNTDVVGLHREGRLICAVTVLSKGRTETLRSAHVISSMPITAAAKKMDPPLPAALAAAEQLRYRDFLTVCLIINRPQVFPDNWIYIHDPTVQVGRIQNFKNWSPDMVPDHTKSSLGLEYFCQEGDALWSRSDAELIEVGARELERLGLAQYADVEDGCVFRVPKAYPIYDSGYREHLATLRHFVSELDNFQTIGRNGLHRYDNQDHAMLTGMLAARNAAQHRQHDVWSVNTDAQYLEELQEQPSAVTHDPDRSLRKALGYVFPKLDAPAFGLAVGLVAGVLLLVMTLSLVVKGGSHVGLHLQLLGEFLPGYRVTTPGSVLGLVYGFGGGFMAGWLMACLRNTSVLLSLVFIQRRAEIPPLRRLLDYV